jgi:TPP-dependent pyruvate/acetoin dehydrogenase alpha subunit
VFFCQNNGFAISYPTSEQTKSETIAIKAEAYGMPGIRVDGNFLALRWVGRCWWSGRLETRQARGVPTLI